jgi:ATP-dependent RNA helicase DDX31/DBP7
VQSKTDSGKTLAYLLPIVHFLASSTDDGRRPSPGGGAGAAGADRKSRGTWCVLLCPTRELATQTHSFADRLCRASFPRIVPGCLSGGEKRKSEKAQLRRGHAWAPAQQPDKDGEPPAIAPTNRSLEWLVLNKVDRLLDGGGLWGQVEQIVQWLRG